MARHPIMRADSLKSIRIPDLMGGINLRDSVSMINDNQMTDCLNMWWADGTLRTRPGIEEKVIAQIKQPESENALQGKTSEIRRHNCTKEENGRKGQLCSVKTVFDFSHTEEIEEPKLDNEGNETEEKITVSSNVLSFVTVIDFFWCFGADNKALPPLEITGIEGIKSYFAVWHNDTVYCFLSNRQIHKYVEGLNKWAEVKEEDTEESSSRIYVPLVVAYCKTKGSGSMSTDEVLHSGVMYEGYNLLSNYYRMQYEAFNYEAATGEEGEKSHAMMYFLLERIDFDKYKDKVLTVKHIQNGNTYEHSVKLVGALNGGVVEEKDFGKDNLKMKVNTNRITFYAKEENVEKTAWISEKTSYSTIEITAPYIPDNRESELERIFSMKDSCWYGGSAEGMDGGTRLFLCGSEEEKALVIWSGRNNPLYFPENSYFYVGDKSGAVTGFGKQSNLLIIFKNDETWCTQYYRNSDITASDLINQTVVDYTSSSVYFPLTQINSNIGCMYPDTVALCRNRLVWLSHNGQVCTLISENQYNERSIFCVSEMVSRKLKDESVSPTACDWNGHYVLAFGGRLYLMDYNSYGYQYITSYSKAEDANLRIPWYYWEMPIDSEQSVLSEINGNIELAYTKDGKVLCCIVDNARIEDSLLDSGLKKIDCYFTTKLFDFDAPANKKNIQLVNLLLGNDGRDSVKVELVTERGTETQEIELEEGETTLRSAGYITNKAIIPCIKAVRIFGVKVSASGMMAVDGMQFNYRILGGIR